MSEDQIDHQLNGPIVNDDNLNRKSFKSLTNDQRNCLNNEIQNCHNDLDEQDEQPMDIGDDESPIFEDAEVIDDDDHHNEQQCDLVEMIPCGNQPFGDIQSNDDRLSDGAIRLTVGDFKQDFYEGESFITIVFYVKKLVKDSVSVGIQSDHQSVVAHFMSADDNYILTIQDHIKPKANVTRESRFVFTEKLKHEVLKNYQLNKRDDKFELMLYKNVRQKWNCIWAKPNETESRDCDSLSSYNFIDEPTQNGSSCPPNVPVTSLASDKDKSFDFNSSRQTEDLGFGTPPSPSPQLSPHNISLLDAQTSVDGSTQLFNSELSPIKKSDVKNEPLTPPYEPLQIVAHDLNDAQCSQYGMTGIENLGNTCFMNSVIQCLANTDEFRDYFIEDRYKDEINFDNPLGNGGKIAHIFAAVTKQLWSKQRTITPSKFKLMISEKVSTQFAGFLQHDAQEFMAYLLDALHEDLNRIKQKPYIAINNDDNDNRSDKELADEAWMRYKMRDDSVVVDLFQGQYKSKLVCPNCQKLSITFDPILYLSVPLTRPLVNFTIYFFGRDKVTSMSSGKPKKFNFKLRPEAKVQQLLDLVSERTQVKTECMRPIIARYGCIEKHLNKQWQLPSDLTTEERLLAFEIADYREYVQPDIFELAINQKVEVINDLLSCKTCGKNEDKNSKLKKCTKCKKVVYCDIECQRLDWNDHKQECNEDLPNRAIGCPFIITIPKSECSYSKLCQVAYSYAKHSIDMNVRKRQPVKIELSQYIDSDDNQDNATEKQEATENPDSATEKHQANKNKATENTNEKDEANEILNEKDETIDDEDEINEMKEEDKTNNNSQANQFQFDFHVSSGHSENSIKSGQIIAPNNSPDDLIDLSSNYVVIMRWFNNNQTKYTVESKQLDHTIVLEKNMNAVLSLEDCIRLFTEPEKLDPQEAWFCPKCRSHQEAIKQLSLWRLPHILVIQLKRFSFKNIIWRDKLDDYVHFPVNGLDLSEFYCQHALEQLNETPNSKPIYDLYAVINHYGGQYGGHYIAMAKSSFQGQDLGWRKFDDSRVERIDECSVVTRSAYMLFYKIRN